MILETDRMMIREWREEDVDQIAPIYADPQVMQFLGSGKTCTLEQTKKIIVYCNDYYRKNGFGILPVVLKETNSVIGHCGLQYLDKTPEIEIDYALAKDYWGRGLATEAAKAVLADGFNELKLKRIVAVTYPQNLASINVVRKLGMTYEGEAFHFGVKLLKFKSLGLHR